MPKVKFTKEDLLGRVQLNANWYKLKIGRILDWRPGKKDPEALVLEMHFVIDDGPNTGTVVKHWFSEKQMDRLADFMKIFASELNTEKEYELDQLIGRQVLGYVKYDAGTKFNSIEDFKKAA